MAIPGISAALSAQITRLQEANFQHYLETSTVRPSSSGGSPTGQTTQSLVDQLTILEASSDLAAEGRPIPKNLSVSQAQNIIDHFQAYMAQQTSISNTNSNQPSAAKVIPPSDR